MKRAVVTGLVVSIFLSHNPAIAYDPLDDGESDPGSGRAWSACLARVPTFSLSSVAASLTELLSTMSGGIPVTHASVRRDLTRENPETAEPLAAGASGDN